MILPLDFKKKEKRYQIFIRRFWPWLASGFFVLIIIALLSPFIFRSWTKYPEALRAEIAWRRFESTFTGTCHEQCLARRQASAGIWRPYYRRFPEAGNINYTAAFAASNLELQTAVVKIMAADFETESLPPSLAAVISNGGASAELKRQIVISFPQAFLDEDWLRQLRVNVIDESLAVDEQLYSLGLLAAFPNASNAALVKGIILSEQSSELVAEGIKIVSAWPQETIKWSVEDLKLIATNISRDEKPLRWRRLWLLTEIGRGQPEMLKTILTDLAQNNALDAITRGLAAESLRAKFELEIITPEPSTSDWQEYYENI